VSFFPLPVPPFFRLILFWGFCFFFSCLLGFFRFLSISVADGFFVGLWSLRRLYFQSARGVVGVMFLYLTEGGRRRCIYAGCAEVQRIVFKLDEFEI
jgi:hypothetical protein